MKLSVPLAAKRLTARFCAIRRGLMVLAPALFLMGANQAQALNVYTVTWNATDATTNIQTTINNAVSPSRIILENHSAPWQVSDTILLNKPNMEIWIKDGATVQAKRWAQNFIDGVIPLFRIAANGVTMRGYANFFDASDGVATLKMWKGDYPVEDQSRHCISIRGTDDSPSVNNPIIKGFVLRDSGGDGVCINKWKHTTTGVIYVPYNVIVKDVTCDNNHRQGMSVICVDTLTVTNCIFKNTVGHAPQAGVDIEPSIATDVLKAIKFIGCEMRNNAGNNVEINLDKLHGASLTPIDITFDDCLIDGGNKSGMGFFALAPEHMTDPNQDGPTGTVVIKSTEIRDMVMSGMMFGGWSSADRVSMTVQNTYITNCAQDGTSALSAPILFWREDPPPAGQTARVGDITFTGDCHIHDTNIHRTRATVRANIEAQNAGLKDITGTITVHKHPNTTVPLRGFGTNTIDCTLSVTAIP